MVFDPVYVHALDSYRQRYDLQDYVNQPKLSDFRNEPSRFTAWRLVVYAKSRVERSPLFEIARVLVRFDHVASFILNANHSMM
jgi:hypothetical protein